MFVQILHMTFCDGRGCTADYLGLIVEMEASCTQSKSWLSVVFIIAPLRCKIHADRSFE
jgi:hypothetical protein